jgi:drug/metabolite transporter (DMT)-like permease
MLFAFLAAVSMVLGLARWPAVHWELARAWAGAAESQRLVLAAIFDGLNRYLGNFIGEFLGELSFSVFFVLSGAGLLRHERAPRWLGWWGIATGVLGLIGMWRNVTHAVDAVAAVNNYLLPAWMIGFGVWLIRASRKMDRRDG